MRDDVVEAKNAEALGASGASSIGAAAWGLVMFAGCRLIEIFLEAQSMAMAVGQVVLVEWGSARLGILWSAPDSETTGLKAARRAALGAAFGLAASLVLFAVLAASHALSTQGVTNVEAAVLVLGFASAALGAWRDELLLHGVTLRALGGPAEKDFAGAVGKILACGVTSAGAALGRSDATARTVFSAALLGVLFGALWLRDRGAWQPWAANTAFRFVTGTLLSGGLVHGRLADNAWAGGSAGMLGGTAATVALAPVAVLALGWTVRRMSPRPAPIR
jgi:hypothetical protein